MTTELDESASAILLRRGVLGVKSSFWLETRRAPYGHFDDYFLSDGLLGAGD